MRTTHVLRGEEWFPSTPLHIQMFNIFGFKVPKYAHLGLVMKIDETDGSRRKLSKRKDPEAAVSYYHEKGIPVEAVKLYLMTIANSNFEAWMDANKDKTLDDYKFDFKKMSESGSLFDISKLMNISKNYISRLKATEVYDNAYNWASQYDKDFALLLEKYKDYSISVFNIEREQKKPRKDYACYSDIKSQVWYMYDELYNDVEKEYEFQTINDKDDIKAILTKYINEYYDESDDKDTWINKIKELAGELGYAREVKDFKENPDMYKAHVGDVSTVLRVALTSKAMTPDLYELMRIIGKERMAQRYSSFM